MRKKLLAILMACTLAVQAVPVSVYAAKEAETETASVVIDRAANNARLKKKKNKRVSRAVSSGQQLLGNDYIEFMVEKYDDEYAGCFTIGNRLGNPNYDMDDDQILLYGHSSPWSSYSTIRIGDENYIFQSENTQYDDENLKATTTMTADGMLITQTLEIVENVTTGIADTVKISYTVKNIGSETKSAGVRIMLDTMLGSNDGAPFKVPSLGNVTEERELSGNAIPSYWQAFDDLANPSVFAIGTLYKEGDRKPDKVQFASWGSIYDTSAEYAWDYSIDTETKVTNDSAVAIYWNPKRLAAGESTTVSTYYGVGYSRGNANALFTTASIPQKGAGIGVVDEYGASVVEGVSVTIDELNKTAVTGKDGIAVFSDIGAETLTSIVTAQKSGYQMASETKTIQQGKLTTVTLQESTDNPNISSVKAEFDGSTKNLLSDYMYFKSDADKTPQTENNTKNLTISVAATPGKGNRIEKYQLMQGGQIAVESSVSKIVLPVITGKTADDFGQDMRITKLKAGKAVTLRVVDSEGNVTEKALGLKISEPKVSTNLSTTGKMTIGEKLKINVPSNIPVLGNTEISLGWDGLPFEVEADMDGKVRFAINPVKYTKDKWKHIKEDYDTAKALSRSGAAKAFGGTPQKFGAGKVSVDCNITGYGEGYVDNNGNVTVQVGIIVTISQSAKYTQTFFLGWMPVYVSVGEKISLKTTANLNVVNSAGKFKMTGGVGEINPSITLNVDGGVGAEGVLNAGASGRATLAWLHRWSDSYDKVTLTGEMYLVASAWLLKAEKKIASGTWTLYDNYSRSAKAKGVQDVDFYDSDSYSLIDTDYQEYREILPKSAARSAGEETVIEEGVYPNASPRLIQADGKNYLFWLEDVEGRDDANRTALVYSVQEEDGYWSEPVQIIPESEGATADLDFDIDCSGGYIWISIQKSCEPLDESVTLDSLAALSGICLSKLETETGTVTNLGWVTEQGGSAAVMPRTAAGEWTVWAENDMGAGEFFSAENTWRIGYYDISENEVQTVEAAEDGMIVSLDAGRIGQDFVIAYVLDTDGDYETSGDRKLYCYNLTTGQTELLDEKTESEGDVTEESEETEEVQEETVIANPVFAKIGGSDVLVWYRNAGLYYTSDLQTVHNVFEEENVPENLTANFSVCTDGTQTQIIWEAMDAQDDNEYYADTAVYAVQYDVSSESCLPAYRLCDMDSIFPSAPNGIISGDRIMLTDLLTEEIEEDETITTLIVKSVGEVVETELISVDYDDAQVAAGEDLPLVFTLANNGNTTVDTLYVDVPEMETITLTDAGLRPGTCGTYTVTIQAPEDLSRVQELEVKAAAEEEQYSWDNYYEIQIGYPDLELEAEQYYVNGDNLIEAVVENRSQIPAEAVLRISADEENGAVLCEKNLGTIEGENNLVVLANLDSLMADSNVDVYYVSVTAKQGEVKTENNSSMIYVGMGKEIRYQVSFDSGRDASGVQPVSMQGAEGETVTLPECSYIVPGYTFTGWSDGAQVYPEYASYVIPEGDSTLTALWKKDIYSITYFLNGGTNAPGNPSSYSVDQYVALANPVRAGYVFAGWYADGSFRNRVYEIGMGSTGNRNLYAKWEKLSVSNNPPAQIKIPAKGEKYYVGSFQYQITNASVKNGTVKLVGVKKKAIKKAAVPASVKINGFTYKVTEIGNKAFKGFAKLKKITLGKNITAIGKKAFYGCRKLSTVVVQGTKLKTIKSGAFKKTPAKMTVKCSSKKVTAKKRAALLKKMKKAGMSKTAKIK